MKAHKSLPWLRRPLTIDWKVLSSKVPADFCSDPTVITGPKTFYIQSISGIFVTQVIRDEQWDSDEGIPLYGAISQ
jgi:hypothetical protein